MEHLDIDESEYDLGWVESNFEEEEIFEPPISPPSSPEPEILPEKPTLTLPTIPNTLPNPNTKKRLRSISIPEKPTIKPTVVVTIDDDDVSTKKTKIRETEKGGNDVDVVDDDELDRYEGTPIVVEEEMEVEEEKEVILSRFATQIDGDCVPVTGIDGDRVYAKICRFNFQETTNKLSSVATGGGALLQKSIRVLMQEVEKNDFAKARASVDEPVQVVATPKATVTTEKLWVDRYSPTSFTELLSDEETNRQVLVWLKQWDADVFGSKIKSTTDDVLSSLRRHSSVSHHAKQSARNHFGNKNEHSFGRYGSKFDNEFGKVNNSHGTRETWDKKQKNAQETCDKKQKNTGPPEKKILLLCGPPGLGKTTLAHIAARHCGYRVVEINASDDRSASTLETKILDVVQMNSVIPDSKPKCLVIDEIDGALGDGKGAVEIILKLVLADRKPDAGKENAINEEQTGKQSRKKQINSSLVRPIICICNDLYVPALRPLREVAKVHVFAQPTVTRVANRLKYICNKEGVKASSIALSALAEYTECDIRSCLNTLQFLDKKKEKLNTVVGKKDVSRSAFDVWKEIFHKRKEKQSRKSHSSSSSISRDFEYLHSLISNCGDYETIMEGIHENMLQLGYVDPLMQKTVKCLDNLAVSDITQRFIIRTQQMHIQAYLPPTAISIHALIAQHTKKYIKWPKSFYRYRTILAERGAMFQTWKNRITPYISRHLLMKSFAEDSLTQMLHILSPTTLRPVALHLLSEIEKRRMGQLVNIMVSYDLTYKNIKPDQSGTVKRDDSLDASSLSLDPPIRNLVCYRDYSSYHVELAPIVKQVLIHEVEKQRILLSSMNKITHLPPDANSNSGDAKSAKIHCPPAFAEKNMMKIVPLAAGSSRLSIPSSSSTVEIGAQAKAGDSIRIVGRTKRPTGAPINFFARFTKVSSEGSQVTEQVVQNPAMKERDARPLFFRHNEGFTNAVKRPVRIGEFLL